MADTSGSMSGRPIASALGLAIYFAERNTGVYKDLFLSFSHSPKFHTLKGSTLKEKLKSINMSDWNSNTNLEKAFELILDTAVKNHIPKEEMPKALIIISDMEIDCASRGGGWSFNEDMKKMFREAGYDLPATVYWNVNSRNDIFHADANRPGVQLVSGQSTAVFKQMMDSIDMTAREAMLNVINSERYAPIKVSGLEKDVSRDDAEMER